MNYRVDFEIPAGLNTFDVQTIEFEVPTNKDNFLTANGLEEADIIRIKPKEARLTINTLDGDLYFIEQVILEMFTRNNSTGKEIFFRENVPLNTGGSIDIIPSLPEVTELLLEENVFVRVELRLRDISPTFLDTRLEMIFFAEYEE